jgi:hypothetical protein
VLRYEEGAAAGAHAAVPSGYLTTGAIVRTLVAAEVDSEEWLDALRCAGPEELDVALEVIGHRATAATTRLETLEAERDRLTG